VYNYDEKNRLTKITFSTGETFFYEYDDSQQLLTFAVSPRPGAKPELLLCNEYTNSLLTRQTLADGSVYSYSYEGDLPDTLTRAMVHTPDGRAFELQMAPWDSSVFERRVSSANP
jgi:hypothetical protein